MSTATATAVPATRTATDQVAVTERRTHAPIPLRTVMGVELRKMFDTRSGFWMLMSIGILSVLATGAVVLWAPAEEQTYGSFAAAIGIPMSIVLPMIAVLSITSEWSQRTGLTTFTLVPHRSRVVLAKLVCAVPVGVASIAVALAVGVLGNIVGSNLAGVDHRLGLLARRDALRPGRQRPGHPDGLHPRRADPQLRGGDRRLLRLRDGAAHDLGLLASAQEWWRDAQPWVDFQTNQTNLYDGDFTATEWSQLAVTGAAWLLLPLAFGLWRVLRSEVK